MEWGQILVGMFVGICVGWLIGVIKGHGETQQLLIKQERKMHALLVHLHRSNMDRLEETDLVIGALANPDRVSWYWERWVEMRSRLVASSTDSETGFYAEMYR